MIYCTFQQKQFNSILSDMLSKADNNSDIEMISMIPQRQQPNNLNSNPGKKRYECHNSQVS